MKKLEELLKNQEFAKKVIEAKTDDDVRELFKAEGHDLTDDELAELKKAGAEAIELIKKMTEEQILNATGGKPDYGLAASTGATIGAAATGVIVPLMVPLLAWKLNQNGKHPLGSFYKILGACALVGTATVGAGAAVGCALEKYSDYKREKNKK